MTGVPVFRLSEIVKLVQRDSCDIKRSRVNLHAVKLFWPYTNCLGGTSWFCMMLFRNRRQGYLRDDTSEYKIDADIPISELYDAVDELFLVKKFANDDMFETNRMFFECPCRLGIFELISNLRCVNSRPGMSTMMCMKRQVT